MIDVVDFISTTTTAAAAPFLAISRCNQVVNVLFIGATVGAIVASQLVGRLCIQPLFDGTPPGKQEAIPDNLLAHHNETAFTYVLSNMAPQYDKGCNNTVMSWIEGLICGVIGPEAGGGHALIYTAPYCNTQIQPPLAAARKFAPTSKYLHIKVVPCKGGG